ncbi:MAG: fumarate hydratase [Candidatus Margulisbacteria bacterium]|nr:fumarate hydratase [Candidatus Margulisiibacteriota bacterium]
MPRIINTKTIQDALSKLITQASFNMNIETTKALEKSLKKEKSKTGKKFIKEILTNIQIAKKEKNPLCQDTGLALVFLEIGQEVQILGGDLEKAIQNTIGTSYTNNYLRKSVVSDPLKRINTRDNTPAIIHTEILPGSKIKITFIPKGGGSENCSALKMLKPAAGLKGLEQFVLDTVQQAQANPCPPIIVGIGIGGNFDYAAYLAKKALLRPLGQKHSKPYYRQVEKNLLHKINKLGIGPMGLGGKITALAVHIAEYPCHIASFPVAINIQCHANRVSSAII